MSLLKEVVFNYLKRTQPKNLIEGIYEGFIIDFGDPFDSDIVQYQSDEVKHGRTLVTRVHRVYINDDDSMFIEFKWLTDEDNNISNLSWAEVEPHTVPKIVYRKVSSE
jgi:hypothetical protein